MRIFFISTDNNTPSGGRKFIYRFVEIAASLGYDAYVLHGKQNFCYDWFDHTAETVYNLDFKRRTISRRFFSTLGSFKKKLWRVSDNHVVPTPDDLIIIPENRINFAGSIFPDVPKIILSQNPFILFDSLSENFSDAYVSANNIVGFWGASVQCVKGFNLVNLTDVDLIPLFIDQTHFHYSDTKRTKIAYMPRRRAADARAIIKITKLRGLISDSDLLPIDGMSEAAVGKALQNSRVFLSFSEREGFGLPPAEAIACGCRVVGYSGYGGDEFFHEFGATNIQDGDIFSYVTELEKVLKRPVTDSASGLKIMSERILKKYSYEKTVEAIDLALRKLK